jgi:hypothetical protein
MSNIKTFVANYLATFLEGRFEESKYYDKSYSVSDPEPKSVAKPFVEPTQKFKPTVPPGTFDREKPKEFETGLKGSEEPGKISHYNKEASKPFEKMKPTGKAGPYIGQETDTKKIDAVKTAQGATTAAAVSSRQAEPDEYAKLATHADTIKNRTGNSRQVDKARWKLQKAAERQAGTASFERKGVIAAPGRERYSVEGPSAAETGLRFDDPARQASSKERRQPWISQGKSLKKNVTTPHTNPNDVITKFTPVTARSQGSGRTYVKSQIRTVTPTTHGNLTTSARPQSVDPNIRVDLPARSHPRVANAVTNALIKTTRPDWEKKLLARQAAVPKTDKV